MHNKKILKKIKNSIMKKMKIWEMLLNKECFLPAQKL